MRFIRKAGAPSAKSPKRLHVEPAELARKLVKEMDDHVVLGGDQDWVRNRYTVYLCPEDYDNLAPRAPQLVADLRAKLAKHVEDMEYLVQGELMVELALDEELELGYFGILAQKSGGRTVAPQALAEPVAAPEPAPVAPVRPRATAPADEGIPEGAGPLSSRRAAAAAAAQAAPVQPDANAYTQVMPAKQAADLGLEGREIVITSGDQVMRFRQSRVIIGRGKEADLRVNDANVSRKHAAIYWNNGRLMIDDLGSTNGTMVNGYPVTRTVLKPNDVVAIGDSRLTVEAK
jgi:hypothetical protein